MVKQFIILIPLNHIKKGNVCFTQLKDGTTYAVYLADENEESLPEKIIFEKFSPAQNAEVELLGGNIKIKWNKTGKACKFQIPDSIRDNPPNKYAWTFKIK